MSRRDRHGSDDYDGQVGHFSQKIFRLKICFFATTLTKVAIIMTCICQIPCFALVCSPQGLFRWQDKHSWFFDRNKQRVCLAHILFQLTPIDTSTTTLYIGGNKGDSNWGQLAAAVGEKSVRVADLKPRMHTATRGPGRRKTTMPSAPPRASLQEVRESQPLGISGNWFNCRPWYLDIFILWTQSLPISKGKTKEKWN